MLLCLTEWVGGIDGTVRWLDILSLPFKVLRRVQDSLAVGTSAILTGPCTGLPVSNFSGCEWLDNLQEPLRDDAGYKPNKQSLGRSERPALFAKRTTFSYQLKQLLVGNNALSNDVSVTITDRT